MYQTPKDLLYQFNANGNPAKDFQSNRTFYAEFKQALKDDETYQRDRNVERLLLFK